MHRRAFCTLLAFAPTARLAAQDDTALETQEAFAASLTAVARQSQAPVLVEGSPIQPKGILRNAQATVPDVRTALQSLADSNDYAVGRSNGCFLLFKRYSDPLDLPCVTLPELRDSLENIRRAIRQFSPKMPPPPEPSDPKKRRAPVAYPMVAIYKLLKDHPARQGGDGYIPLSEVDDATRQTIRNVWADQVVGYIAGDIEDQLQYLQPVEGITVGPDAQWGPLTATKADGAKRGLNNVVDGRPLPAAAPPAVAPVTLGTLAGQWNGKGTGKQITVAPELADKPVSVFGQEFAAPEAMARALATLYGLRAAEGGGEIRLQARRPNLPAQIPGIVAYIPAALPYPLSRTLFSEYQTGTEMPGGGPLVRKNTNAAMKDGAWFRLGGAYQREKQKSGTDVPVSALTPMEQVAYALCVTRGLDGLVGPSRTSFALGDALNKGTVKIKLQEYVNRDGEPKIGVSFDVPDDNGRYQTGFRVSNIRPPDD